MKANIIITLVLVFVFLESSGQRKLSKPEIKNLWEIEKSIQNKSWVNSFSDFYFDDSVQSELAERMEVLQQKFDTVGLILISTYEVKTKDTCENSGHPSQALFFWQSSGKLYFQKITNRCIFPVKDVKKVAFFDFYGEKKMELKGEYILPVILGATEKQGKVVYNMLTTSHDNSYVIYCKMNQTEKTLHFSESDIVNQQGIFFQDNLKSNAYKWFLYAKSDFTLSQ